MAYIDIIYEDCSTEEGHFRLQQHVRKCRPFKNFSAQEDVPFEKLERLVGQYCRKYRLSVQWIRADFSVAPMGLSGQYDARKAGCYHAEVSRQKPYAPLFEVPAGSMYELYCKLCVALRYSIGMKMAEVW